MATSLAARAMSSTAIIFAYIPGAGWYCGSNGLEWGKELEEYPHAYICSREKEPRFPKNTTREDSIALAGLFPYGSLRNCLQ